MDSYLFWQLVIESIDVVDAVGLQMCNPSEFHETVVRVLEQRLDWSSQSEARTDSIV